MQRTGSKSTSIKSGDSNSTDSKSANTMSPAALCEMLGKRIRQARLNRNLTQKETALRAGLSVKAVQSVENGSATLLSLVAVLQALDLASQLELFLPEPELSPRQLLKLKGRRRQRARGGAGKTPIPAPTGNDSAW
ncbi:MAG TPA: helix-turn-helix transcriptional regulator [Hyphomicrobiales bacterium]|nr:helix-turn-helix transcriptional regulator [Hyphomicrobiales bacterium]